jgi:hypothetical protein
VNAEERQKEIQGDFDDSRRLPVIGVGDTGLEYARRHMSFRAPAKCAAEIEALLGDAEQASVLTVWRRLNPADIAAYIAAICQCF